MPTITETPIEAYAHCNNPRCGGNAQVKVDAVLVTHAWKYWETGGDGMFSHDERTDERPRFADPDEATCRNCGGARELSLEPRMELDNSGYDRGALLDIAPGEFFDPDTAGEVQQRLLAEENEKRDAEIAELKEALAEQRGMMQALLGQVPPSSTGPTSETDLTDAERAVVEAAEEEQE